jgi:hypothetical protein
MPLIFSLTTRQLIIRLCSYSVASDGIPIKHTMQIAVKLLELTDVVFACNVFTP